MEHFADRLGEKIRRKGAAVCVGLDPLVDRLPREIKERYRDAPVGALRAYGRGIIEAVASLVPAIKINIAFFEAFGAEGIRVYRELIAAAKAADLIVIGDVKRADIGHSTTQYALAHLAGEEAFTADAVTVNPYLGWDGVEPFVKLGRDQGRGLFVLVQTSNPSAEKVQGLQLADGSTVCHAVARLVQSWAAGQGLVGRDGYSCIGAVVSPRDLPSTVRIRELMPNCLFLVPGFGAQGRTAEEVTRCFKPDGSGALVTASRSVIYAYEDRQGDWRSCVVTACQEFVETIRQLQA
jgi:orotidine-5'-phosphate decarboxylase